MDSCSMRRFRIVYHATRSSLNLCLVISAIHSKYWFERKDREMESRHWWGPNNYPLKAPLADHYLWRTLFNADFVPRTSWRDCVRIQDARLNEPNVGWNWCVELWTESEANSRSHIQALGLLKAWGNDGYEGEVLATAWRLSTLLNL